MYSLCVIAALLLAFIARAECCHNLDRICDLNVRTLQELFEGSYTPDRTVCVNLEENSAPEFLDYRDASLSFSVVIRGNGRTVSCVTDEVEGKNKYPLHFTNSSFVVIENLNFKNCIRPLLFEWVGEIQLVSSSFSYFSVGGAVEISNSPAICIEDSSFVNDSSLGIGNRRFSGNAGGVAIGYSQPGHLQQRPPNITISGCNFANNTAGARDDVKYPVLQVLSERIYNQRGGGAAFFFGAEDYNATISISNCQFTNNVADDSGGGIYMFLDGPNSSHTISISDSTFYNNYALDGGGLELTHANANSKDQPHNIVVTRCNFTQNTANFGGGYKNIQLHDKTNLNRLTVEDCVFIENEASVGAGIYLQSIETVDKVTLMQRITLTDCTFRNNMGKRGTIFVIGNVIAIEGDTLLEGSVGPALRILGTLVILKGNIMFRNNSHHPEGFSGALYLSSFGQIMLFSQTNITFLNNTGREGACIVVKGQLIASAFTRQLYNPQCFLQYQDPTQPPPDWNVSMLFEGNRANVGPVVFLSDGEICLWTSSSKPFFAKDLRMTWRFMDMRNNYVNINNTDSSEYYIQTEISSLEVPDTYVSAYPGESVSVKVTALDQFNKSTSAFIGINSSNSSVTFEPSIVPISPGENNIKFQYSGHADGTTTVVHLDPFFTSEQNTRNFTLHHDSCLPGYKLTGNKCVCTETELVILCLDDGIGLLLAQGYWGASLEESTELVTHTCPPGYCKCEGLPDDEDVNEGCLLLYKNSSRICIAERDATLCGRCKEGYGVGLLTNDCQQHSGPPHYYWLVPAYLILVVVCLVVVVKLGLHLPTLLRGFLFYIQIAPIAVTYFPAGFNVSPTTMACIASTFAFYSPYDFTFHEGMTSLESYGLRFLSPLLALLVVPLAARVRQHRFKYWHGIWTVILLMYVMNIETSVSILFCPSLGPVRNSSSSRPVWFFDGTVTCFTGWHIPLTIAALLTLLLQTLIFLVVAASIYYKTLRKKYVKFEQLERFSIVVTHGIKHEYKWWPIMELGCRFIFVTAVILSPGYLVVPLVLCITIFVLQTVIHPYKNKLANYTESFLFLWLVGLLSLANTTALQNNPMKELWPLLYIPVMLGAIVLFACIGFVIWKRLKTNQDKIRRFLKMSTEVDPVEKLRSYSVYNYRLRRKTKDNTLSVSKTVVGLDQEWAESCELELPVEVSTKKPLVDEEESEAL